MYVILEKTKNDLMNLHYSHNILGVHFIKDHLICFSEITEMSNL